MHIQGFKKIIPYKLDFCASLSEKQLYNINSVHDIQKIILKPIFTKMSLHLEFNTYVLLNN